MSWCISKYIYDALKLRKIHFLSFGMVKFLTIFCTFNQCLLGPGAGPDGAMAPTSDFGPGPNGAKAPTYFFGPGPSGAKAPTHLFGPGPSGAMAPTSFFGPAPTGPGPIL